MKGRRAHYCVASPFTVHSHTGAGPGQTLMSEKSIAGKISVLKLHVIAIAGFGILTQY